MTPDAAAGRGGATADLAGVLMAASPPMTADTAAGRRHAPISRAS